MILLKNSHVMKKGLRIKEIRNSWENEIFKDQNSKNMK